jgi:hypothetical protein
MALLVPAKYGVQFLLGNGMKVEIERVGDELTIRATSKDDGLGAQEFVTLATFAKELRLNIEEKQGE